MKQSTGGMQTAGLHYSIICPKCGKSAARKDYNKFHEKYLHFTKNGAVWHEVEEEKPPCGAR